jgi:hypothetical protein
VKKTIFAVTVVLALALTAAAADKKPATSVHFAGNSNVAPIHNNTVPVVPPALCNPCIFYGGDINPFDINADGFSDENTLLIVGGSNTYGAVVLPYQAALKGIVFNIEASDAFDPQTATYDIREGVSEGNGGFSVQSGSSKIQIQATGRNAFGLYEYAISVHFPTVTLEPGVEYWFNVQPQCTNGATDASCYIGRFFVSNTTQGTNNIHGMDQPGHSMFFNSTYFGFAWANWCDAALGTTQGQCNLMSYGLVGTTN